MTVPPMNSMSTSVHRHKELHTEEGVDCTCHTGICSCGRLDFDPARVGDILAAKLASPDLPSFAKTPRNSIPFSKPEEDAVASLSQQKPQVPSVVSESAPNKTDSMSNLESLLADTSQLALDDDPTCCCTIRAMQRTPSRAEAPPRVDAHIRGPEQTSMAHTEHNDSKQDDKGGTLSSLVEERPTLAASGRPTSRRKGYYTREEVAQHNKIDDCWLIAHGRVYDVTSVLFTHPAGAKSIMRHAGGDSTVDFDFHSAAGRKVWAPLQIGYVDDGGSQCTIS